AVKRGDPDSSGQKQAGLLAFLCRLKDPIGPSSFIFVPGFMLRRLRLNAVSRRRVANMSSLSHGALAIENVRVLPSESVSGGSTSVRSAVWPALKLKSAGFCRLKASVPSATSDLFRNSTMYSGIRFLSSPSNRVRSGSEVTPALPWVRAALG